MLEAWATGWHHGGSEERMMVVRSVGACVISGCDSSLCFHPLHSKVGRRVKTKRNFRRSQAEVCVVGARGT